jgi:P pilus assembly chaperone PapD
MNESQRRPPVSLSFRLCLLLVMLAFAVALAVVVGNQMSREAMAVLMGIVCGILTSIPTSVVLVTLWLRREKQKQDEQSRQGARGAYPPVVVIQGGSPQQFPMAPQAGYWPAPASGPVAARQFHVVGEDELIQDMES